MGILASRESWESGGTIESLTVREGFILFQLDLSKMASHILGRTRMALQNMNV